MRLLLVAALMLAPAPDADACSCVERTFAEHAKTAKRVVLVRAGKPEKTGDALKQTFTILATFKGPADKQFDFSRTATPPCVTNYREGEVSILFIGPGTLDPCYGNTSLDDQVSTVAEIVKAAGAKTKAADAKATAIAVADALKGYKAPNKNDVKILKSFTSGTMTFVRGKYEKEGLRFDVILARGDDGTWTVVYRRVVET